MSAAEEFDIAVVGGGLAGLVFAGQLVKQYPDVRLAVAEANPPDAKSAGADIDLRVSAITPASRAILEDLDVWQQLPADRISPYRRMCVWQAEGKAGGRRSISFDAAEVAVPELGCIVENEAIRRTLWSVLESCERVQLLAGVQPATLERGRRSVTLEFEDRGPLKCRLIVGADGSRSWVRNRLGIDFREFESGQSAIVGHVATGRSHDETAWQRFLPGGPVALLPLADGASSFVWSCPAKRAEELIELDDDAFASELAAALDHVLGTIECVSERTSFPLVTGYATNYTGRRFALIGDAAHRVHPLAGLGANLGLLDAAELAELLAGHFLRPAADPGDASVLRRYERARKSDNLLTMGALDAINRVFTVKPFAEAGGVGLDIVDRLVPLKNLFARYAMGVRSSVPAAARLRTL